MIAMDRFHRIIGDAVAHTIGLPLRRLCGSAESTRETVDLDDVTWPAVNGTPEIVVVYDGREFETEARLVFEDSDIIRDEIRSIDVKDAERLARYWEGTRSASTGHVGRVEVRLVTPWRKLEPDEGLDP